MIQELKKQVCYFINNKVYMLSLVFAAIAGYGFEITHTSMGIDDVCIEIYFEDGLGVAIGRWPFYLINKLFHITDFEPFILEFLAVVLMVFAAILWSSLMRAVLQTELPIICYIVFSAMFMDYSLIAEVFVYYLQNGVGIIYCLTAVSLFIFYDVQKRKLRGKQKLPYVAAMSGMMCVAISFYESAASLFLLGLSLVMLTDVLTANRMELKQFQGFFDSLFLAVRVLVYSIVGRTIITRICMLVFGIEEYNYRSISGVLWIFEHPGRLITLLKQIVRDYVLVGVEYYPIGLFVVAALIFIVAVVVFSVRKKNIHVLLLGIASMGSIFVLSIVQGDVIPYRANQMLSVFVAYVLLFTCYYVTKFTHISTRVVGLVLIISVVYNSAFDLNHWFSYEYKRNQLELEAVHHIAYELRRGDYAINEKPVVFVGEYRLDSAILEECTMDAKSPVYGLIQKINASMDETTPELYPYTQVLSCSFLNWTITSFSEYEGYNKEIVRLFEKEGLSLIWGGDELYQKGVSRMTDLNRYPVEGYIKEYHDMILVRF